MAKTKTTKTILKTVAAGFACVMCTAFFPANAVVNALENYSGSTLENVNTISVNTGDKAENQQSLTVKKGEPVTIPTATYSYKPTAGGEGIYTIGSGEDAAENITSSIVVKEKDSGTIVAEGATSFRAEKVGTYVVTYTVNHGTNTYSYDLEVVSQATEASFDFETNVENVIPNVYDISIADNKDIVLPLPTVMGENEETLLANDNIANFVTDSGAATGDVYVKISLTNGGEGLTIEPKKVDGKDVYVISGEKLSEYNEDDKLYTYDGKTIKVVYSFLQDVDGKIVYIASTSKSFTVREKYYYTDSTKKESEYELVASLASAFPSTATVGVEQTLPSAIGTTKSVNSPASEGVQTYYTIQVLKKDENNKWTNDVTNDVITEGNKFTAKEEGSYKFIYTVKDFYGHTADSDTVTKTIENVKDSKAATAFMYDAVNPGYDSENKTYESAENNFKTKALNRNIIMYAVGGTDNMVDNDKLTLRREIRNYSGVKEYVIEEALYNGYNLVFAPTLSNADDYATAEAKENALYKQIADENFALRSQMELAQPKVNTNNGAAIKAHMAGKYLLVTTEFNKDVFGNTIDDTITSEDDEDAIQKMIAKGYAYITPVEGRKGTFNNQSYTFYYFASDNINKEHSIKKDIEFIEEYHDEAVPTLTFSSDLQASYLATDKFSFNVVSATDNQDSRLKVVTAYRYLNDKGTAVDSTTTTSTIKYFATRVDKNLDASKWYNKTGIVVEVNGWYISEEESTYTIDLNKKPKEATQVEIFAYAIDDNGNAGFFNKTVAIADATDLDMPVLQSVKNAPTATDRFSAPDEISLPKLTFADAKANYMTAKVLVTKIERDQDKKIINTTPVASYGMNAKQNSYLGTYSVEGGYFRASVGGEYQVAITVVDAANHSVTSYFTYNVKASVSETLDPTIDNISSAEETVKPGKTLYLTPPSISLNKDDAYGYIGLEKDDDTNTATWYNVEAISSSDNDYKILNNLYFSAGTEGTYKLKYTAYLIKYTTDTEVLTTESSINAALENDQEKQLEGEEATALAFKDMLFLNSQGQLCYFDGASSHVIYLDEEDHYNVKVMGLDTVPSVVSNTANVEKFVVESDAVITVTVSSATLAINDDEMDLHYGDKTEYNLNDKIEVIKPIVTTDGTTAVDADNTTVTITRNSTTLATIKLSDWNKTEDINLKDYFDTTTVDGKIYLVFVKDGKYTITYNVDATVGGGDTYSVTLSAGDVTAPELEIGDKIVEEKYKVGDTLHIAFSHTSLDESILKMSDKVTTKVEDLLESMTVKIKYESESYQTIDKEETEEGFYEYSYDLSQKGTYTLSITITDEAGNSVTKYKEFEVGSDEGSSVNTSEVMGGVLIGISVALLAGVIIYFVVSKNKLDKKEKSYRKERSKSRRK